MAGIYASRRSFFNLSITLLLIIGNLIFFIISLTFYKPDLIDYIAINPANIFSGKYLWTFLTSMFIHAGFFHLFVNMLSLFFIGSLVEKILGRKRYLFFYLISGLFAGIFFVLISWLMKNLGFPTDFDTFAVGASGALFGLTGLLMLLTPNLPVYVMFIPIPIKMKYAAPGLLIVLWLISVLPSAFGGQQIQIGNTAHLGGFIMGLIYGAYLKNKYKNKTRYIQKYFS